MDIIKFIQFPVKKILASQKMHEEKLVREKQSKDSQKVKKEVQRKRRAHGKSTPDLSSEVPN